MAGTGAGAVGVVEEAGAEGGAVVVVGWSVGWLADWLAGWLVASGCCCITIFLATFCF